MPTVLKPSQIMRRTKAGKMPHSIKGGRPLCLVCKRPDPKCGTESPMFWENGMYCHCPYCAADTLHGAVYPPCEGYPDGLQVDTAGERKKYPPVLNATP